MKEMMKTNLAKLAITISALSLTLGFAQTASPQTPNSAHQPTTQTSTQKSSPPNSSRDLEPVLSQMDESSKGFRNAQADFEWRQYQKVVDETDIQKGTIYFVRGDKDNKDKGEKGTEMAADITVPD